MIRLRQMADYEEIPIKATKYWSYYKYWRDLTKNVPFSGAMRTNGKAQTVLEPDFVRRTMPTSLFARYSSTVPFLNPVQMSKVTYPPTTSRDLVHYSYQDAVTQITALGPNAALVPLTYSGPNVKVPNTVELTEVNLKMASYLLQKAYSRMSTAEFDFGVTVGEVAETAAMLALPLGGIAKLTRFAFAGFDAIATQGLTTYGRIARNVSSRELRRLKGITLEHPLRSSLRIVDESANHWLAYKFGVLPFIEDVNKVLDFKGGNVAAQTGLRCARVASKVTDTTVSDLVNDSPFSTAWWISYFATARKTDQHHCGLYFRNKINAPLVNFMESIGFAPWQLPSLTWELIPLSFVVDRFIDVKSFVRGNIGGLSKETFGSFCTRKIDTTYAVAVHKIATASPSFKLSATKPLRAQMKYEQMARAVNLTRPKFPVVNPHWQQQLTADATNLALIWGRLRNLIRKSL